MRRPLDVALAQTITWIWLGFLLVGGVAWLAYRYWRKRHPPPAPAPDRSYSQRLEQRLAKKPSAATHGRRDGPTKIPPRRRR